MLIDLSASSYYTSTPSPDEPYNRHVYYTTTGNNQQCLTCDIQTPEGNTCSYASASFSRDLSHYVMTCSGPDPAFVKIYRTAGHTEVMTWEDNAVLRTRLLEKELPQIKIFKLPIADGFNAVVRMQLPTAIDFEGVDERVKYPMLVRVYGGPGSIRILNSFSIGYHTYQITNKNIVHVEIDGRGASQMGNDMMYAVNNKLGSYEIIDQIAVAKELIKRYKFIDPERTAIWGW